MAILKDFTYSICVKPLHHIKYYIGILNDDLITGQTFNNTIVIILSICLPHIHILYFTVVSKDACGPLLHSLTIYLVSAFDLDRLVITPNVDNISQTVYISGEVQAIFVP